MAKSGCHSNFHLVPRNMNINSIFIFYHFCVLVNLASGQKVLKEMALGSLDFLVGGVGKVNNHVIQRFFKKWEVYTNFWVWKVGGLVGTAP